MVFYKGTYQETLSVHFFSPQLENCYMKDYWEKSQVIINLQENLAWLIIEQAFASIADQLFTDSNLFDPLARDEKNFAWVVNALKCL